MPTALIVSPENAATPADAVRWWSRPGVALPGLAFERDSHVSREARLDVAELVLHIDRSGEAGSCGRRNSGARLPRRAATPPAGLTVTGLEVPEVRPVLAATMLVSPGRVDHQAGEGRHAADCIDRCRAGDAGRLRDLTEPVKLGWRLPN